MLGLGFRDRGLRVHGIFSSTMENHMDKKTETEIQQGVYGGVEVLLGGAKF